MPPPPKPPQPADQRSSPSTERVDGAPARRRIDSQTLFAGAAEVEIEHQSQVYRLRRTSLGKLILTK